jgi:tetratricopeptide (TPR) repeat protein/SAM-dependent methyltransferase
MSRAAKRHQKKLARKAALKRRSPPARASRPAARAAPADYLSELTHKGLQLHRAGRLPEAEAIYRQVLDAKPGHADANHLLGGLAHQAGNHALAVELISKAVAKAPKQPAYCNNLANALHALGRLDEAVASYRKAIAGKPDYAEAHNNLANVLVSQGQLDDAVAGYGQALAINPDYAEAHYNLANALQAIGRSEEAIAAYEKALAIDPDYADAHGNLANVLKGLGRLEEAVARYHMALAANPAAAEIHNNLASALETMGQADDAIASYRRALAIKPGYAEAHYNLGAALKGLGRAEEAVSSYQSAIAANPEFTEAHNNLGNALRDLGRLDEAVGCYGLALAGDPDNAEAHANLGAALQLLGRSEEALAHCRRAIALKPQNDAFWSVLVTCLQTASFAAADEALFDDLLQLLERPSVRSNSIAGPVISALRHHPDFTRILKLAAPGATHAGIDFAAVAEQLAAIPLFLRIIEQSHINDLEVERLLTVLRRAMLEAAPAEACDDEVLPVAAVLALHCFTNEYVFSETDDERAAVEALERRIGASAEADAEVPPVFLAVLAAYRPLHRYPWAAGMAERAWPDEIKPVIARQLAEPLEEQSLRGQIAQLTPIDGAVSQAVRAQYEANPYPRWVKTDIESRPRSITAVLRGSPLHFDLGEDEAIKRPEILVAGCGTGQHALQPASIYEDARVLAVDLSLSSLSYAARKTRALGFSNIEYAQADITRLGGLGREFDLIECSGVLHHLGDPMAGWRVLVDLLRPGGFMKIGLYSETAREPVVKARALIAERGYTSSADDIRRCREDIIAMAAKDEGSAMARLVEFRDLYSLSECRDLIFHVQEHRFTLPRIEAALAALKLGFLGFEMRDHGVLREFKKAHPQADATASLALWHQFELANPDTFRGMYQFWCRKA